MAGESEREDRTEAASARRLQQARDDGQAPLSREAAGLAVLVAAAALLGAVLPGMARPNVAILTRMLGSAHLLDAQAALALAGRVVLQLVWPFCVAAVLAACVAVFGQTRFLLRPQALMPDISRIDPRTGLGRLLSREKLADTGLALLKITVMGFLAWGVLRGMLPMLSQSLFWTPVTFSEKLQDRVMAVAIAVLTVQTAVVAVDILRTHLRFHASLRMTRQDLRDEARESEGDPHVKGRIKQMRLQRAKRRMLQAVPKATLVVTNPTHYAVALAYERGQGGAPRIIAKGVDEVAARIRDVARNAGVPLIANPPLARALYPLPLDSEVPAEHFQAVAELIAYVWRLRPARRVGA
ncbi:MAG: flagellar type III secretion system protein FlhB [Acetobacteraceae bacterium]|nr:flagellar type III secretion system protein FlhB [Acetobacteraceae bacterium]